MAVEGIETKKCWHCGKVKSLNDFYRRSDKIGWQSDCKSCNLWKKKESKAVNPEKYRQQSRANHLKRTFDLSVAEFNGMVAEQGGGCAICNGEVELTYYKYCVDHSHASGNIRGILCRTCNLGLGAFKDDVEVMRAAIEYLEKHRGS